MKLNYKKENNKSAVHLLNDLYKDTLFLNGNTFWRVFELTNINDNLGAMICEITHHKFNVYHIKTPSHLADVNLYCKHCENTNLHVVNSESFYCVDCDEIYHFNYNTEISFKNVRFDDSPHY